MQVQVNRKSQDGNDTLKLTFSDHGRHHTQIEFNRKTHSPEADSRRMTSLAGIHFSDRGETTHQKMLEKLRSLGLDRYTSPCLYEDSVAIIFSLNENYAEKLTPSYDTSGLALLLNLNPAESADDLEREIILAMLAAPISLNFPSYEEFVAALQIRCQIVWGARRTQLAFHTSEAERPSEFWTYMAGRGFTVLPGKSLIEALVKATQPETSEGKLYSFSCYRATEYVILLAIARVLAQVNPTLFDRLQAQWEQRPIMSGEYHEVFLREYGSLDLRCTVNSGHSLFKPPAGFR